MTSSRTCCYQPGTDPPSHTGLAADHCTCSTERKHNLECALDVYFKLHYSCNTLCYKNLIILAEARYSELLGKFGLNFTKLIFFCHK